MPVTGELIILGDGCCEMDCLNHIILGKLNIKKTKLPTDLVLSNMNTIGYISLNIWRLMDVSWM